MSMAPAPAPAMHAELLASAHATAARTGTPEALAAAEQLHTISYAAGVWTGKRRQLLGSSQDGAAHAPEQKPKHAPAPAPHARHALRRQADAAERTFEAEPRLRAPHELAAKGTASSSPILVTPCAEYVW